MDLFFAFMSKKNLITILTVQHSFTVSPISQIQFQINQNPHKFHQFLQIQITFSKPQQNFNPMHLNLQSKFIKGQGSPSQILSIPFLFHAEFSLLTSINQASKPSCKGKKNNTSKCCQISSKLLPFHRFKPSLFRLYLGLECPILVSIIAPPVFQYHKE